MKDTQHLVSPSCTVSCSQHKVSSYQEATAGGQVILRSDNFQIGHVGAGMWYAFRAPNDLLEQRTPRPEIGMDAFSRECTAGLRLREASLDHLALNSAHGSLRDLCQLLSPVLLHSTISFSRIQSRLRLRQFPTSDISYSCLSLAHLPSCSSWCPGSPSVAQNGKNHKVIFFPRTHR